MNPILFEKNTMWNHASNVRNPGLQDEEIHVKEMNAEKNLAYIDGDSAQFDWAAAQTMTQCAPGLCFDEIFDHRPVLLLPWQIYNGLILDNDWERWSEHCLTAADPK